MTEPQFRNSQSFSRLLFNLYPVLAHFLCTIAGFRAQFKAVHIPYSNPFTTTGCTNASQEPTKRGQFVKLIIATIKPFKLEEVREALTEAGVRGMMVTEIKGFGSQSGHTEIYRGAEYAVNFVPKVKLEIVVASDAVDGIIETITKTAHTGKIGDGKIFVLDVSQAVRVRTGETNEDAL